MSDVKEGRQIQEGQSYSQIENKLTMLLLKNNRKAVVHKTQYEKLKT